ncbi:dihydropyrimidine dehydrogenase (NADP(+)), chloroplastic-like [Cicer arietinum]|uniref:Dihydropyrimidine dehydrogenase (NADP(+)), chloroplastic-like n=1 Tax=Cicer arietinum TaxID=3827 RepID=A0A1S2YTG6_CICAR|nr:dihydropyrimidine dehydrogenase (NADP(+)), chloroplastic-like [Cicer arietinum]XP_004509647.1 dihydropyrimidine dehydrogenase (NADP(+)), chloroplastic-like [Cicer arietinum]XP_004509648.1 dihydropyrimidine dehydrogenase (NADP(+)), chloroplastic-like [Cicer arietinum]XP_004509649.1 dihydropyrimidine dehydrogenase (NADP(+)), chloroplastic-like [Cicer arietinum]XP_012573824.1 dihydropyrimidine dehydrogenase (NADP(+)), chloroplastic-like [Cicer arietinum]
MHIMAERKFLAAKKSERENLLKQLLNPSPVDKVVAVAPEEDANTPLFPDALEINFSCLHGMPERKMGAVVGQDCALLEEVCGWINAKAIVPVWAKMTPNITDISQHIALWSR